MDTDDIAGIMKGSDDNEPPRGSFAEAISGLKRSLADADDVFAKLPSFERIREKWRSNGISDDDAAWILMEAASVADQRNHMRMLALSRVLGAHSEVLRFSVSECSRVIDVAGLLDSSVTKANAGLSRFEEQMQRAAKLLKSLAEALGPLIDYMHRAMKILEERTMKAALLQVGIIVASMIAAIGGERLLKVIHLW